MSRRTHARAEELIAEERVEGISQAEREWLAAHIEECMLCADLETSNPKQGDFGTLIQTELISAKPNIASGTLFGNQFLRLVQLGPFRLDTYLDGTMLIFSFLSNNWTVPVRSVERVQDAIAARLAGMRLR